MSAHITGPLEPFIVPAKVLRPGAVPAKVLRPGAPVQSAHKETDYTESVIRSVEIVAMLLFTAASAPLIATGIVFGFVYLIALIGILFLVPAVAGLIGLYGIWVLLLRSDNALVQNQRLRRDAIRCVNIGMLADAGLAAWALVSLLIGTAPANNDAGWIFWILMVPVAVGMHRVWRLQRLLHPLGIAEEGRILLLLRRSALALGVTLERFGKPELPPRHAKWGARL